MPVRPNAVVRLAALTVALAAPRAALGDIINVPADQPTIQAGINAAGAGDEVVVQPGTYFEHLDLLGKAITVRSTDPTVPAVVESTIIDGSSSGTVVLCISGEGPDTVLAGFVITHGLSGVGGGMRIDSSDPTVMHCVIVDNNGQLGGGISAASSSDPTIIACTIRDNVADNAPGGGGGIANVSGSQATLTDTLVCGNVPDQIFGQYVDNGGNVIADDCPADCPWDLDGSGDVGVNDFLAMLANWGNPYNVNDFLALLADWGPCP
jgi:hypothetical protein